jgi:endonuclease III
MPQARLTTPELLDKLEEFYGKQEPSWPVNPYEFIVWWQCGYPASDAACTNGWEKLKSEVGIEPYNLLAATLLKLATALTPGGMMPELRALRVKEIAAHVKNEFGGDLRTGLTGPVSKARVTLKRFPGIGDAGADRILLFAGITPVAAVPSNCAQVLVRILYGKESKNYGANYRESQRAIAVEVPGTFDARTRAYLLLKYHGQEICKRTKPKCEACPVNANCAFFAGQRRFPSAIGRPAGLKGQT